jgi:uncharacterized protein YutD
MSNLSRRSLVASAAALPALAVPAVAVAATDEPGPIFAAIQAFLDAERADSKLLIELEDAREHFKDVFGMDEPDAFCKKLRQVWAQNKECVEISKAPCRYHETIDKLFDSGFGDTHEDKERLRSFFHKELDKQIAAYGASVKPVEDAQEASSARLEEAAAAFVATIPTTPAGLRTMLVSLRDNQSLYDYIMGDWTHSHSLIDAIANSGAKFLALA